MRMWKAVAAQRRRDGGQTDLHLIAPGESPSADCSGEKRVPGRTECPKPHNPFESRLL
jgi:hypothetical protein